jgi:hypothetical protein
LLANMAGSSIPQSPAEPFGPKTGPRAITKSVKAASGERVGFRPVIARNYKRITIAQADDRSLHSDYNREVVNSQDKLF